MIKQWISGMTLGIVITCFFLAAYNYVVDPYGVIRRSESITNFQNQAYKKIEHLKKHKGEFNGLILGSSRVSGLDVSKISQERYYNLSLPLASPETELLNLKYIHENINPIKHVFLGVDAERMYFNVDDVEDELFSQLHPDVSNQSKFIFYSRYFMRLPNRNDFKNFWLTGLPPPAIQQESMVDTHGVAICYTCMEVLKRRPPDHLKTIKKRTSVYVKPMQKTVMESVNEVALLTDYMNKNNIHYTVFITPKYAGAYRFMDFDIYYEFKKRLSYITPYLDFDELNAYTKDRYMFHDVRHISHEFSNHISENLVVYHSGSKFDGNKLFHYTDSKNVDAYIEKQRIENDLYIRSAK